MTQQDALELIQPLFDLLTRGDVPEGVSMSELPTMTPGEAFSLIWFLQEVMHVLPDTVELCAVCCNIFDHATSGHIIAWDGEPDEWYQSRGITEAMIRENEGVTVCSDTCEDRFWRTPKATREIEKDQPRNVIRH